MGFVKEASVSEEFGHDKMGGIMRKLVTLWISLAMVIALSTNVFSLEVEETDFDIIESSGHQEIEQLYDLRAQLCAEYEENENIIRRIDEELVSLGVVELTEAEVVEIMGVDALPQVSLPSETDVKWTSERSYTVTNGLEVEYQIIRAVLDGPNGALQSTASVTVEYNRPVQATALGIGEIVVKEYAAPVIEGVVDTKYGLVIKLIDGAVSFFDIWSDINDEIEETTVIDSVRCTYTLSFVAEEKYIYVKYRGAPDAGYQTLCYAGNRVQYEAVYAVPGTVKAEDGSYIPHVETEIITGKQSSEYYDSALAYAVTNFFIKYTWMKIPLLCIMLCVAL